MGKLDLTNARRVKAGSGLASVFKGAECSWANPSGNIIDPDSAIHNATYVSLSKISTGLWGNVSVGELKKAYVYFPIEKAGAILSGDILNSYASYGATYYIEVTNSPNMDHASRLNLFTSQGKSIENVNIRVPTGYDYIGFTCDPTGLPENFNGYNFGFNYMKLSAIPSNNTVIAPKFLVSDHYGIGPGKVAIHLAAENAIRSGNNIVGIKNTGGAGALFDATVSGSALAVSGKCLDMKASATGTPVLANPATLNGVCFMWVCSTANFSNGMRLFGNSAGFEIRLGTITNGSVFLQLFSNASGSGVNFNITPRFTIPTGPELSLFELTLDGASARLRVVSADVV